MKLKRDEDPRINISFEKVNGLSEFSPDVRLNNAQNSIAKTLISNLKSRPDHIRCTLERKRQ